VTESGDRAERPGWRPSPAAVVCALAAAGGLVWIGATAGVLAGALAALTAAASGAVGAGVVHARRRSSAPQATADAAAIEARAAHYLRHDALTGMPNRAAFAEALNAAIATGEPLAVLFVDLDKFKAVNDRLGLTAGDALLRQIGRRLAGCIEPGMTLARLGGDEFAVLAPGGDEESAQELADILVDALLAPALHEQRSVLLGGSIGVALGPHHGGDAATLIRNAELAVYQAKADGRGCVRFFRPGMDRDAMERAELATDLRVALAEGGMELFFQPLVDSVSGAVTGRETLLRWRRQGHGLITPARFIDMAETTGVIVPLGEWVIGRAIEEAAGWRDPVAVAINLSPLQIRESSLVGAVAAALDASGLDPARLELEVTESVLMAEADRALAALRELKALGVRIALDDFGTGFSSLAYLRVFPFDKLKIDQGFVRDLETSRASQAIVRAVISLAHELGMKVTAEGVETASQAAMLAEMGCREVQGYLYSRPQPAADIPRRAAAAA
jgi:diguanylate cyclase (GGDEF)-like protein